MEVRVATARSLPNDLLTNRCIGCGLSRKHCDHSMNTKLGPRSAPILRRDVKDSLVKDVQDVRRYFEEELNSMVEAKIKPTLAFEAAVKRMNKIKTVSWASRVVECAQSPIDRRLNLQRSRRQGLCRCRRYRSPL